MYKMKNNWQKGMLICGILTCLIVWAYMPAAMAATGLNWTTDSVYFDYDNRLVIEGCFYNNSDRIITWVNWHELKVFFKQYNTRWWHHATGVFDNLDVFLYPGDSVRWTFRIYNVDYAYFENWRVDWNSNYNYK